MTFIQVCRSKLRGILAHAEMRWSILTYNFAWPDYVWLLNSWLAKAALLVPAVGYAILFNDTLARHVSFDILASETPRWGFLSGDLRLRLLYFGAMSLGAANFLYVLWRPYVMKLGVSQIDYVDRAMASFTMLDFQHLHQNVHGSGSDPATQYGKYLYHDFQAFELMAQGAPNSHLQSQQRSDWLGAKERYGSMLRSLLIETYFRESRKRRVRLTICIIIGLAGILMLFVPSFDLFLKVLSVILWPSALLPGQ